MRLFCTELVLSDTTSPEIYNISGIALSFFLLNWFIYEEHGAH